MKTSKIMFGISIFIGFAFLTALFLIGILGLQNKSSSIVGTSPSFISANGSNLVTLTSTEVAKHNTQSDCWMIINNKVYDFTSLISTHSGGAKAIITDCGKDGTQSFATKDGQGSHSSFAVSLINNYYIGDLGQSVTSKQLNTSIATAASFTNNSSNNYKHEDEEGEYEDD